jgi:molybdate transport system regulatory protein
VRLKGGEQILAAVSSPSLDELIIAVGDDAVLMINSADVLLAADSDIKRMSARNRLFGKVMRIQQDIGDSEVIVLLPGGEILAAMVTRQTVQDLALAPGVPVWAVFKAYASILGVRPS